MDLPATLRQMLDQAQTQMQRHPQRQLPPAVRRDLYIALGRDLPAPQADAVRVHLDWLTAQFVLPVWRQAWPAYPFPQRALRLAGDLLRGMPLRPEDAGIVSDAASEFDNWVNSRTGQTQLPALFAGYAALMALLKVRGMHMDAWGPTQEAGFRPGLFPCLELPDSWYKCWCDRTYDTPLWATGAWAGGLTYGDGDARRRQAFWTWWLGTAVPCAWQARATPPATWTLVAPPLPPAPAPHPATAAVWAQARAQGTPLEAALADYPQQPAGWRYAAQIAPYLAPLQAAGAVGVPFSVNSHTFQAFFQAMAHTTQQHLLVADTFIIWLFHHNGRVSTMVFVYDVLDQLRAQWGAVVSERLQAILAQNQEWPFADEIGIQLLETLTVGPQTDRHALVMVMLAQNGGAVAAQAAQFWAEMEQGVRPCSWAELAQLAWLEDD